MSTLDLGDQLIDSTKSSNYLYYLARASNRVANREIAHKKVKLAINQLKKISTKHLHKHVDELEGHIAEAIYHEKQIKAHQQGEEAVHHELTHKIGKLEHKLGRYLETQEARKKRVQEIEDKIKQRFKTKQETIDQLKDDIARLTTLYKQLKKDKKHPHSELIRVANRIAQLKDRVALLK